MRKEGNALPLSRYGREEQDSVTGENGKRASTAGRKATIRRQMRRLLIMSAIAIAGLVASLGAWIAGARSLSLLLDGIHTVQIDSRPITEIVLEGNGGTLRINDLPLSLAGTDYHPYPMMTKVDPERHFVIESAGHAISLGRVENASGILRPELGDRARLQVDHSMLSWPTPLAINFISGNSPSWKRNVYYRFIWEKPNGGRLEMVWRYEQYFYDDWASGFMTTPDSTGLIRVDIHP